MIDLFIMSNQAKQVYYLRYPGRMRDKVDWAVVVKIKPRAIIEVENNIELAHQEEEMSTVAITTIDETPLGSLIDPSRRSFRGGFPPNRGSDCDDFCGVGFVSATATLWWYQTHQISPSPRWKTLKELQKASISTRFGVIPRRS